MDTISQALRNLGPMRLAVVGALFLGLVGFFIFVVGKLTTPSTKMLYSGLDAGDSQKIVAQIQSMGVVYELKQNGSQIFVDADEFDQVLIKLADQGLPGGGTIGYEIFDEQDSLSSTNFMQNVNLARALEGELARTIQTISSVRSARVHLVLPKRELFSREKQEPSASVVLTMKGAQRLSNEQVSAVQHLIATAVPSLQPSRISVVDNKGKLLAAGAEDNDPTGALAAKADDRRRAYETRMARTIEELLERTVGFGKVRAEVHAEMDFDRISTQEETFDADGQVPRSTQTIETSSNSKDAEGTPPVSVGTNLPDANLQGGDSASSSANETRTEETTNFEISKKVINHVREIGIIKRLSVAVLVDGKRVENNDGDMVHQPIPQPQMELLATLVRGAIGYNEQRGDTVEVINMEFADYRPPEEPMDLFIFGLTKNDIFKFAEMIGLVIIVLLVIILVVRPLLSRVLESGADARAMGEQLLADHTGGAAALAGPGGGVPATMDSVPEEEQFEELIDIDRIEGRVKASSVKKVGEIVDKHPDEALSIVRAWMYQES
ncbi:MAG: flagellar basal-body MS-ring/collar protein FliF [Rhodospirillaceae bacterium]